MSVLSNPFSGRRVAPWLAAGAVAATAIGVAGPATAAAPIPLTVTVIGAQYYGSSAVGWAGTPSVKAVTESGVTCTKVTTGAAITPSLPAGTYTIDGSSCSGGTLSSPSYSIGSYAGSTFTVYKSPLILTPTSLSRAYGKANPALTYSYSGFVNGDDASALTGTPLLATTATASSVVGSYPIAAAAGSLRAANYNLAFAGGTLSVTAAPVTVTILGAQYYGSSDVGWAGSSSVPGVTETGASCGTVNAGTAITPTLAANTYTVDGSSCGGGTLSNPNYAITSYVGSSFSVFKTALTVTVDNQTRNYGVANAALTYTISGFANGQDASVVTGTPALTTPATISSAVGSYPITAYVGTLHAANYSFIYVPATLTVTSTPVTVTATGAQYYGSSDVGVAGTASDKGVTVTGLTCTTVNGGTAISPTLPVGTYTVDGSSCSGGTLSNPNYSIASYAGGSFSVFRTKLTVQAGDAGKTYADANPALTYSLSGFVNGEDASVLTGAPGLSTTATASSGVGSYPITATTGNLRAANYYFAAAPGTLTVTPATLTVAAIATTRPYGSSSTLPYTLNGFVNGDKASAVTGSPALTSTATATSDPGTYPVTISAGTLAAANYGFTFVNSTLTVTRAVTAMTTTTVLNNDVSATLTYGSPAQPVVGATVTFTLGKTATVICTAVTNAAGTASCRPSTVVHLQVVLSGYTATYAGSVDFTTSTTLEK